MEDLKLFFEQLAWLQPALNSLLGVFVYFCLKMAFIYGRSYGRDKNGWPISDTDWISELFQFLIITLFWLIILFARWPAVWEGLTLIQQSADRWFRGKTAWLRMTRGEREVQAMRKRNERLRRQLAADLEKERLIHERIKMTERHLRDVDGLSAQDLEPEAKQTQPFETLGNKNAAAD